MSSLSDAEILAALPVESRQKINNAFEALSQSSLSPAEQVILYRVAHTLKLNPTDTVFSVMAAMHYYLQLYQTIPTKIAEVGGEIRQAGFDVDKAIREATKETLIEHADALKVQAKLIVAQSQLTLIHDVGKIAQKLAGDSAASERQKSFAWAAGSMTIFGALTYMAGMALGSKDIGGAGWGYLSVVPLVLGLAGGMALFTVLFYGDRVRLKEEKSTHHQTAVGNQFSMGWTKSEFDEICKGRFLDARYIDGMRDVFFNNLSVVDAAEKQNISRIALQSKIDRLEKVRK